MAKLTAKSAVTGTRKESYARSVMERLVTYPSSTCLYTFVPLNQLFKRVELRAKQMAATSSHGAEGWTVSSTPTIPSAKHRKPPTAQRVWLTRWLPPVKRHDVAWNGPTPPGHAAFADRAASGYAGPEGAACSIKAICSFTSHAR